MEGDNEVLCIRLIERETITTEIGAIVLNGGLLPHWRSQARKTPQPMSALGQKRRR